MKDEGGKDLRLRTKQLALRIIRLYQALPRGDGVAQVLGKQLLRAGTSVAAHYREACRAKSNADFINKLEGGLQELDEADLWLDLLSDAGTLKPSRVAGLRQEIEELISIFVSIIRKLKAHR